MVGPAVPEPERQLLELPKLWGVRQGSGDLLLAGHIDVLPLPVSTREV